MFEGVHDAARDRAPSKRARRDTELSEPIRSIHEGSRGTYGMPRVHAELAADGVRVGRKRVACLMRAERLEGVSRRRKTFTTLRDRDARAAPDLVERDFNATAPDQLWVADITFVPTWSGFLYLAVVLDVSSRRVVGWAMMHLRTELVLDALNMALEQRRPTAGIHHSDQGCQYTSIAFDLRCREAGVRPSMGSVGDAYDNALCESFFATLECELIDRRRFRSQVDDRWLCRRRGPGGRRRRRRRRHAGRRAECGGAGVPHVEHNAGPELTVVGALSGCGDTGRLARCSSGSS